MVIYLLTFYLFDDIEKNIEITHANHSATSTQFWQKCSCNLNVYIFYLRFALGIIQGDRCHRKTRKQLYYSSKAHFLVVEASNTVTFWRNGRVDVILTSVTAIKYVSLRILFCYESLVDIEFSKIIDMSYTLGSSLFVCFVALRPKSTAMVIAGRSVHLTTLFPGQAWTSS